jgi:DNA replication protein DnaC
MSGHSEYYSRTCEWCHAEYEGFARFCRVQCAEAAYQAECAKSRYAETGNSWLRIYRNPPPRLVEKNPGVWDSRDEWMQTFPRNLYVWGDEGTGKTSLCCNLLCHRLEHGFAVRQVTALDLELHLKYAFNENGGQKQAINELGRVSVLLIDDVSAAEWTPRGLSLLRFILDWRHRPNTPCETYCTSNLSPTDMSGVIDRICGDGAGIQTLRRLQPVLTVQMAGSSYRMEMGAPQQRTLAGAAS